MNKCFIYIRVSTEEQAKEGFSTDNQERACVDHAKTLGYNDYKIFTDDGKSGRTTERPAFQDMLGQAREGGIEAVIIYKIDRFARNVSDFAKTRKELEKLGIALISVCEGNLSNSNGLIANIFASVAEWESDVNGQRTRDAMMQKFRGGWQPTPPPLGYKSVGGERERKSCEPDPINGPIIQELFNRYSTGNHSVFSLQRWLTKKNVFSRTGKPLSCSVVNNILNNPFYYGLIRWHGEEKIGLHKALISRNLFDTCQYVMAKHRNFIIRSRKHSFLLNGVIFCSECGQRYTAEWHHNEKKLQRLGGKIGYYHCQKRGRNKCPAPNVEVSDLENQVADELKGFQFSEEFIQQIITASKNRVEENRLKLSTHRQGLNNKKQSVEIKRNRLEDALLDGTIDRETFKRRHLDIQGQIDGLNDEIRRIENDSQTDISLVEEVLSFSRNISETYREAPPQLKTHYLRFFFEKVFVKDKKVDSIAPTPFFDILVENNLVITKDNQLPLVDAFRNREIEFGFSLQNIQTVFETFQIQPAYSAP